MSRPMKASAKPLLPPGATPGAFETDGRRHESPLEEAFQRFLAERPAQERAGMEYGVAFGSGIPTPEPGFSPLGEGLEVRHG